MRTPGIISAAALLGACATPQASSDGYVFGEPEFTRTSMTMEIVIHDDLLKLRRSIPNGHVAFGRELMAWSAIDLNRNHCEVQIIDPRHTYAPEALGHELTHCIYGRWHD